MSIDNVTAIENLAQQKGELEKAITDLSNKLDQAKAQYLRITGALDVLSQIQEANQSDLTGEELVESTETEVVEEE